jgi:hypothetical protein
LIRPAALFLVTLGLLQMLGDLAGLPSVRAIGAVTSASPAPKVFSAVDGFETYSTRFFLLWRDDAGEEHVLRLTPELSKGIRGPYNRRNPYGAVIAYAPILFEAERTRPMFAAVAHFSVCGHAPLLHELGIDPTDVRGPVRLRVEPLSPRHGRRLELPLPCP